ncbi:hypothetical protein TruAng_000086 [Truncatella angustata]|nr:hypothetical protein TruAng_000086 [Truncatella angustata]
MDTTEDSFVLEAEPGTDIWKKPPTTDVWNDPAKWIKTGLEFYNEAPHLSTVACDRWADWSILPLTGADAQKGLTLEVVRESDEHGKSAWVYHLVLDDQGQVKEKRPLREICWIFADEDENDGEAWVLDVSPLVARPEKNAKDALKVDFTEFKVEWLP